MPSWSPRLPPSEVWGGGTKETGVEEAVATEAPTALADVAVATARVKGALVRTAQSLGVSGAQGACCPVSWEVAGATTGADRPKMAVAVATSETRGGGATEADWPTDGGRDGEGGGDRDWGNAGSDTGSGTKAGALATREDGVGEGEAATGMRGKGGPGWSAEAGRRRGAEDEAVVVTESGRRGGGNGSERRACSI